MRHKKRTIKEKNHKVGFQKNVKLFLKKLKKEKKKDKNQVIQC